MTTDHRSALGGSIGVAHWLGQLQTITFELELLRYSLPMVEGADVPDLKRWIDEISEQLSFVTNDIASRLQHYADLAEALRREGAR